MLTEYLYQAMIICAIVFIVIVIIDTIVRVFRDKRYSKIVLAFRLKSVELEKRLTVLEAKNVQKKTTRKK